LEDPAGAAADLQHHRVAVGQRLPRPVGVVLAGELEGLGGVLVGDGADGVGLGGLLPEPAVAAKGLVLERQLV
jgi:hypothetical protein